MRKNDDATALAAWAAIVATRRLCIARKNAEVASEFADTITHTSHTESDGMAKLCFFLVTNLQT